MFVIPSQTPLEAWFHLPLLSNCLHLLNRWNQTQCLSLHQYRHLV